MSNAAYPLARNERRADAGLTLVEVAAIVSVIGMLLAVAIPTLARSVRASKVAEASEQLDHLYQSVAAYYATQRTDPNGETVYCLPEPAGPAPNTPSATPVVVDFASASTQGAPTWVALAFTPHVPLRYRYTFSTTVPGCSSAASARFGRLTLRAEGDLDDDGAYSTFERYATVQPRGELLPDLVLHIEDRVE